MAQTKIGAAKAKAKILANNPNHYKEIGSKGGKVSTTGGFAYMAKNDPERHVELSAKGGKGKK